MTSVEYLPGKNLLYEDYHIHQIHSNHDVSHQHHQVNSDQRTLIYFSHFCILQNCSRSTLLEIETNHITVQELKVHANLAAVGDYHHLPIFHKNQHYNEHIMNPVTYIHDYMRRKYLELTSGDAEFQNEILYATWSSIIRLIFGPVIGVKHIDLDFYR